MKILVLNSGSSSLKYQVFKMPEKTVLCSGLVERIGLEKSELHYNTAKHNLNETAYIPNHKVGLERVVGLLLDNKVGILASTSDITAVGHRVVHGGSSFTSTTVIDEKVSEKIQELFTLAPLHNPPNHLGIEVAKHIFPEAKQVAVFDTAFHQTIPTKAYKYAIPNKFLKEHNIRLYGFHGTSHKYVSEKAIAHLGLSESKIISIHLGNGCSMTAIKDGKSIDHTLGFSPVNGLIMGTRSGDIDHTLIFHLVNNLGYELDKVNDILQKQSGMLGLTGHSDLRDIEAKAEQGDQECSLALAMNTYRIKKYIGAYAAAMNGLDALIFTAGIGENSSYIRSAACEDLSFLGIELDQSKNDIRPKALTEIQTEKSKVKILIIPTNEEVEIAQQAFDLIGQ